MAVSLISAVSGDGNYWWMNSNAFGGNGNSVGNQVRKGKENNFILPFCLSLSLYLLLPLSLLLYLCLIFSLSFSFTLSSRSDFLPLFLFAFLILSVFISLPRFLSLNLPIKILLMNKVDIPPVCILNYLVVWIPR